VSRDERLSFRFVIMGCGGVTTSPVSFASTVGSRLFLRGVCVLRPTGCEPERLDHIQFIRRESLGSGRDSLCRRLVVRTVQTEKVVSVVVRVRIGLLPRYCPSSILAASTIIENDGRRERPFLFPFPRYRNV